MCYLSDIRTWKQETLLKKMMDDDTCDREAWRVSDIIPEILNGSDVCLNTIRKEFDFTTGNNK